MAYDNVLRKQMACAARLRVPYNQQVPVRHNEVCFTIFFNKVQAGACRSQAQGRTCRPAPSLSPPRC